MPSSTIVRRHKPTCGTDTYWRAANYLSVGQIDLYDNPLLKRPLTLADVKHMLLGHWGTTPGQNFIYVHLNRVIKKYDLDMIYVSGPGHGGPAVVGNTYLEGTYSEIYPDISQDEAGLRKLFIQFSFPVGAHQLVRQDGGRVAHFTVRNRCNLPRRAHQLASAYKKSLTFTDSRSASPPDADPTTSHAGHAMR